MTTIVLYTRRDHPECALARELLWARGLHFEEVDVGDELRFAEMVARTGGAGAVPQLFIDDYHINGWRELKHLEETGVLENMVSDVATMVAQPSS